MSDSIFIKQRSGYIQSKKHMLLKDGSYVLERDISTISANVYENDGQNIIYNEGNFIISVNTDKPSNPKVMNSGSWVSKDDLLSNEYFDAKKIKYNKEYTPKENTTTSLVSDELEYVYNFNHENVRMFATYGSAFKFFNYNFLDIIKEFPASLYIQNINDYFGDLFYIDEINNNKIIIPYDNIVNKFGIDLFNKSVSYENLKNIALTYKEYIIEIDGITYGIQNYSFSDDYTHIILELDKDFISEKKEFHIKPKTEYLNKFYSSLNPFQKTLLNVDGTEYSYSTFMLPIENEDLDLSFYAFNFKWGVTDGYNIDVDGVDFNDMFKTLSEGMVILDKYYSDFLYRMCTHDSIKMVDYYEDDVQIYDKGRVKNIISIYGRNFDDLKKQIYCLSNVNLHSFNNVEGFDNNLYFIKLKELGWDSIGLNMTFNGEITLEYHNIIKKYSYRDIENEFNRRLFLTSKKILKSKGTKKAIQWLLNMLGIDNSKYELNEYSVRANKLIEEYGENDNTLEHISKLNRILYRNDVETSLLLENDPFLGLPIKKDFVCKHIVKASNDTIITDKYISINGEIIEVMDNEKSKELYGQNNIRFYTLTNDYETIITEEDIVEDENDTYHINFEHDYFIDGDYIISENGECEMLVEAVSDIITDITVDNDGIVNITLKNNVFKHKNNLYNNKTILKILDIIVNEENTTFKVELIEGDVPNIGDVLYKNTYKFFNGLFTTKPKNGQLFKTNGCKLVKNYEYIPNYLVKCVIISNEEMYDIDGNLMVDSNGDAIIGRRYHFTPRMEAMTRPKGGFNKYSNIFTEIEDKNRLLYRANYVGDYYFVLYPNSVNIFYVQTGNFYGVPKPLDNTNLNYYQKKGYWYNNVSVNNINNIVCNNNNPHYGENYGKIDDINVLLTDSEYFQQFRYIFNSLRDFQEEIEFYENYKYIDDNGEEVTINFFEINGENIGFNDLELTNDLKLSNSSGYIFIEDETDDEITNIIISILQKNNVKLNSKILEFKIKDNVLKNNIYLKHFIENNVLKYMEQLIPATNMFFVE